MSAFIVLSNLLRRLGFFFLTVKSQQADKHKLHWSWTNKIPNLKLFICFFHISLYSPSCVLAGLDWSTDGGSEVVWGLDVSVTVSGVKSLATLGSTVGSPSSVSGALVSGVSSGVDPREDYYNEI